MSEISGRPDLSCLEIPFDAWTLPFWEAVRAHRLKLPRCASCGTFRWPPGPFCPGCRSQAVEWHDAGAARIFSFTIVRSSASADGAVPPPLAPSLIEFPEAGGVRLLAAVVDSPIDRIGVGAAVAPVWGAAANAVVPMFRLL